MKTPPLLAVLLLAAATVAAQPPPPAPPGAPPPAPPDEPRRALDRWLNGLEQENPEEHRRLVDLRDNDPEAFRQALRERRDHLRERAPDPGLRRIRALLAELPPGERELAVERCVQVLQWQGRRPRPGVDPEQVRAREEEVAALAQTYREAPPARRRELRAEIRGRLNQIFEAREDHQRQQIEEAEQRLRELKDALEIRRKHHREIVRRRLQELTGEAAPP